MPSPDLSILRAFLYLGLTSFGGPIAHLAYFRAEFVVRRAWVSETQYAQLLTLTQLLPGPASSQMGFALGMLRGGWGGALTAFAAFTLPSALLLTAFASLTDRLAGSFGAGLVSGLKLTAVCVVADALIQMAPRLTPDLRRLLIAVLAAMLVLAGAAHAWSQLAAIALGAGLGLLLCRSRQGRQMLSIEMQYSRRLAAALLVAFALLLGAAIIAAGSDDARVACLAGIYRAGALVFGGGHVVLPLLQETVVGTGRLTTEEFLAGYGAAQAVPGPMFSLAAYLGMQLGGPLMALAALVAIFLPGFLLVAGVLPFWSALTGNPRLRAALAGINAAVVGVLGAAFYDPVWRAGIDDIVDVAIAAAGFSMLLTRRVPTLAVVVWCVVATLIFQSPG